MKILFLINGQGMAQDTMKSWANFLKKFNTVFINDLACLQDDLDLVITHSLNFEIQKVKRRSPSSKIFLLDPRLETLNDLQNTRMCDLVICGSIEQQDFCLQYNENTFIYPWINFETPIIAKKLKSDPVISYHGNLIHLNAAKGTLIPALTELSYSHKFVFKPVYNIKLLGLWKIGRPKNVNVVDTQWNEMTYYEELNNSDIGVVPNYLPVNTIAKLSKVFRNSKYNYNSKDYFIRYKFQSNPNRIYDYMKLCVPVVAENYPSSSSIIQHGSTGFLVQSKQGWKHYLEKLLLDPDLRNRIGKKSNEQFCKDYNFEKIFIEFSNFVHSKFNLKLMKANH